MPIVLSISFFWSKAGFGALANKSLLFSEMKRKVLATSVVIHSMAIKFRLDDRKLMANSF